VRREFVLDAPEIQGIHAGAVIRSSGTQRSSSRIFIAKRDVPTAW
jgi:hypothetical protein